MKDLKILWTPTQIWQRCRHPAVWVLDDTQNSSQVWSGGNAIQQHSVLLNEQAVPSSAPPAELETQVLLHPCLLSHSAECAPAQGHIVRLHCNR